MRDKARARKVALMGKKYSASFNPVAGRLIQLPRMAVALVDKTDEYHGKIYRVQGKDYTFLAFVNRESSAEDFAKAQYYLLGKRVNPLAEMGFYEEDSLQAITAQLRQECDCNHLNRLGMHDSLQSVRRRLSGYAKEPEKEMLQEP